MSKFTKRKGLRLARRVMVRSALREYRSVLIALDAPPHSRAPHHLSVAFLRSPTELLSSFSCTGFDTNSSILFYYILDPTPPTQPACGLVDITHQGGKVESKDAKGHVFFCGMH